MPRFYIYIRNGKTLHWRRTIDRTEAKSPHTCTKGCQSIVPTQGIYTALRLGRSRFPKHKSLETDLAATDIVQVLPEREYCNGTG